MRVIPIYEKKQRGCSYCIHVQTARVEGSLRTICPLAKCPYTVLDKYKSYEEFMASEDSKILVDEYFISCAGGVELTPTEKKTTRNFSDGDSVVGL